MCTFFGFINGIIVLYVVDRLVVTLRGLGNLEVIGYIAVIGPYPTNLYSTTKIILEYCDQVKITITKNQNWTEQTTVVSNFAGIHSF